jgi:ribonuclease BN (tRNA processing enzyme)
MLRVQFVGCGDAFGSGGRFNTCIHVRGESANFLIDCGATSLVALKQLAIDRNAVEAILLSHFHADHFGGVPFFLLDGHFVARRERPLTIAGPPGLPGWCARAMDAAFPGFSTMRPRFDLSLHEFAIGKPADIGAARVKPFHVLHDDRAGPCLALRIEVEGRVIAFSGDTEWTEALIKAGRGADLFICECYSRDKPIKSHLSYAALEPHLGKINPKRLVLTHMSEDMLARRGEVPYEAAADGLVIEL